MQFMIPLRNPVTGEERNFHDKQQVADFLATREDDEEWEGWKQLGQLPEPTPAGETPAEAVNLETPEQIEAQKLKDAQGGIDLTKTVASASSAKAAKTDKAEPKAKGRIAKAVEKITTRVKKAAK